MTAGPGTVALILVAALAAALLLAAQGVFILRSNRALAVRARRGLDTSDVDAPQRHRALRLARATQHHPSPVRMLARALAVQPERVSRDLLLKLAGGACVVALALVESGVAFGFALAAAMLLALLATRLALLRAASRARARLRLQLPDAVALIVRCLRAGVPVSEAIAEAGRATPAPLGALLAAVHRDVRLGRNLETALWAVARQIGLPEFNFLCVAISIQRETGGNLAETLAEIEATARKRLTLQLKVKALSSEARTSALVIGALPILMAVGLALMAPSYLAPLVETAPGRLMLAAAVLSLLLGVVAMVHIVRREV